MNFIEDMEHHEMKFELKYCERCGGLWLRIQGNKGVHCTNCHAYLSAKPNPGEALVRKTRSRRKRKGRSENTGENVCQFANVIGQLEGVAMMEVRA